MHALPDRPTPVGLVLSAALVFAACSGGPTATATSGASAAPSQEAPASDTPVSAEPAPRGGGPGVGGGELTVPQPGQLDVHPVAAERLESAVDGRKVTLRITWTSGVEPCYVLDTIGPMRSATRRVALRRSRSS